MCEPRLPEEPLPSDCCNSGCNPCILDVYRDMLSKQEEQCNSMRPEKSVLSLPKRKSNLCVLSPTKYTYFSIKHIENVCEDVVLVRLQAVIKQEDAAVDSLKYCEVSQSLDFSPGQYLILRGHATSEDKDCFFSRPYTPLSDNSLRKAGSFEVVVKFYPGGQMSQYWQNLAVGDVTLWRGPYGNFVYKRNTFSHILMLCAGTGVAPMYSIANSVVHDELDETFMKMLLCCKNVNGIILRRALHSLQSFWNFGVDIYLSHESEPICSALYGEILKTARVDQDIIISELQKLNVENTLVLICGSSDFCGEMDKFVNQSPLKTKQVHVFS